MKNPKNVGASVRQRLLDFSRSQHENYNLLLTRYAIERLLYRLSRSAHADRFVLKGAALYAVWQGESELVNYRPTRDLDFWSLGTPDVAALVLALREVVMIPVEDDGIRFDAATIKGEVRRADEKYPGCNIEMLADVGGIAIRVLIDVGFGDAITPSARRASYPTILKSFAAPQLQIYPRETVIAEKFEAMVALELENTRLKDFYDIWILSQSFDFDGAILSEALRRTFERRQTALPAETPIALGEMWSEDAAKTKQWKNFGQRILAPNLPPLRTVTAQLQRFLLPVAAGAIAGNFNQQWTPQHGWRDD